MNKDLLSGFVNIATGIYGQSVLTQTDDYIKYSWEIVIKDPVKDKILRDFIKTNGWNCKNTDLVSLFGNNIPIRCTGLSFNILYNKNRDSFSIYNHENGLGWSDLKSRLYPISKNRPLLCISKKLYAFTQIKIGKRRYSYKPRIYTGRYFNSTICPYLKLVLNTTEDVLKLNVSYRHMKNSSNPIQSLIRYSHMTFKTYSNMIDLLGVEINVHWLINWSKGKVNELINLMQFRKEEGLLPENKDNLNSWYQSADFINEDWYKEDWETEISLI